MPNLNFLPEKLDFITINHEKLSLKAKEGVANLVVSTVHCLEKHKGNTLNDFGLLKQLCVQFGKKMIADSVHILGEIE